MERLVKKFEQRYRRARCHLATWSDLQSRLLKQFSNAASILDRLPVSVVLIFAHCEAPFSRASIPCLKLLDGSNLSRVFVKNVMFC